MAVATFDFNALNQAVITWTSAVFGTDFGSLAVPNSTNAVEGTVNADFSAAGDGTDGGVGVALQNNEGDGLLNWASLFVVAQRATSTTVDLVYGDETAQTTLAAQTVTSIADVQLGLRVSSGTATVFLNGTEVASFTAGGASLPSGGFGVAFSGDPANVTVLDADWTDTIGVLIEDGSYTLPDAQSIMMIDWDEYRYRQEMNRTATTPVPQMWAYKVTTDGIKVAIWPAPESDCLEYRFEMHVPQDELLLDGTDDATELTLPWRPLYLGAWFLALNERGEEIGEPGNIAERRYNDALYDAIDANDGNEEELLNRDMRAD